MEYSGIGIDMIYKYRYSEVIGEKGWILFEGFFKGFKGDCFKLNKENWYWFYRYY